MNPDIEVLIQKISRLPGLGQRSARRIAIHLIQHNEEILSPLLTCLKNVHEKIKICSICGNVDTCEGACSICSDESRRKDLICIVENVTDLWAIERTSCFNGVYHVLEGLLSSINEKGPEVLLLDKLSDRCEQNEVSEIIIALSATVEGQTTDYYIKNFFKDRDIKVSSLAHGIPMGGELDYLDDGTLFTAFSLRK